MTPPMDDIAKIAAERPTIAEFVFDWFNERDPDSVAEVIAIYDLKFGRDDPFAHIGESHD